MTIKRYLKKKSLFLYRKIVRENASPSYIAKGWAIGMFYGCFLPFGTQLFFSIPTSFIIKGSKIGACLGTLITNHFTIFLIYPLQCFVGSKILGQSLTYEDIKAALAQVLKNQDWDTLLHLSTELLGAFFVGGLIFSLIMTPATYFFVKYLVENYRRKKELDINGKRNGQKATL